MYLRARKKSKYRAMAEYCPFVFWLPICPSTVHRYFDSLCVRVRCFLIPAHPVPPGNSGSAKRLCCKAKSLPRAWELLGSDIYSFVLPGSPLGIPGILGILVRNSFAPRINHFHGLQNYWEVKNIERTMFLKSNFRSEQLSSSRLAAPPPLPHVRKWKLSSSVLIGEN